MVASCHTVNGCKLSYVKRVMLSIQTFQDLKSLLFYFSSDHKPEGSIWGNLFNIGLVLVLKIGIWVS